ncbi:hypothetical protein IAW_05766 [Bacillus cereus str. Schrouff]|nr:hypothetical protein IAW_05766 [Bacillus cereus str. Schrouff]EOO81718.1 hypothetical protein IGY_05740 [Bacillus cereus K-5975c]
MGVILGPSISYNEKNNKLLILSDKYKDTEAFKGLGNYLYAHDEKLRARLLEIKKGTD